MRDLFDQIQNNNLELLGRRRKPNKGSRLARHTLKVALGSDDAMFDSSSSGEEFSEDEIIQVAVDELS